MAREKRLIDANAVMEVLKEKHDWIMQDPEVSPSVKWGEAVCHHRVIEAIEKAPTVDAVEVVRCKDCKWFNKQGYDNSCEDDLNLHMGYCREWRRGTQACGFCSYGERKKNG